MRHLKADKRLGRRSAHREALVAALVCGLITDKRIQTTLPKAKVARQAAERLVTLARQNTLAARRRAVATLRRPACVKELFEGIVPQLQKRQGGYTRIVKLGHRGGDGAEVALVEWLDVTAPAAAAAPDAKTEQK